MKKSNADNSFDDEDKNDISLSSNLDHFLTFEEDYSEEWMNEAMKYGKRIAFAYLKNTSLIDECLQEGLIKFYLQDNYKTESSRDKKNLLIQIIRTVIIDSSKKESFKGLTQSTKGVRRPKTPAYIYYKEYKRHEVLKNENIDDIAHLITRIKTIISDVTNHEGNIGHRYLQAWFYKASERIKDGHSPEVDESRLKTHLKYHYLINDPVNNSTVQAQVRKTIQNIFRNYGIDPVLLKGLGVLPKYSNYPTFLDHEDCESLIDKNSAEHNFASLKTKLNPIVNKIWIEEGELGHLFFRNLWEKAKKRIENEKPPAISENLWNKHLESKYPSDHPLNNKTIRKRIKKKFINILIENGIDPEILFKKRSQKN